MISIQRARFAVFAVTCVVTLLGGAFIVGFWLSHGQLHEAARRAFAYVAIMTAVSVAGYSLYRRQSLEHRERDSTPLAPSYQRAVRTAFIQEPFVLILTALMLDGGRMLHVACVSAIVYWVSLLIVVVRRPTTPTPVDLFLIRYGVLLTLIPVYVVGNIVWTAMDRW